MNRLKDSISLAFALTLALTIAGSGCKKKSATAPGETASPPGKTAEKAGDSSVADDLNLLGGRSAGYQTAAVENPGKLVISAVFTGKEIPQTSEVPVNTNIDHCGGKVRTENLLVNAESRGLKNVVVRLKGIKKGKAPPEQIEVTNRNCVFEPHVSVAMKKTKLKVANADPILHTTHPYLNGRSWFNVPLADPSATYPARPIEDTGVMEIKCDVHKWMQAYVVVHDNPYIGVSDAKGSLTIDEIPAGSFDYVAWHETLGEQTGKVTISGGGSAELKLEWAPQD